jgi:hypothetical protein
VAARRTGIGLSHQGARFSGWGCNHVVLVIYIVVETMVFPFSIVCDVMVEVVQALTMSSEGRQELPHKLPIEA